MNKLLDPAQTGIAGANPMHVICDSLNARTKNLEDDFSVYIPK